MDKLKETGKKDKLIEVRLFFGEEHFRHLLGLHKLKDIWQVRINNSKLLDDIISDRLKYSDILKSKYILEIQDRLTYMI